MNKKNSERLLKALTELLAESWKRNAELGKSIERGGSRPEVDISKDWPPIKLSSSRKKG
jgi:hypothetical protein